MKQAQGPPDPVKLGTETDMKGFLLKMIYTNLWDHALILIDYAGSGQLLYVSIKLFIKGYNWEYSIKACL